MNVVTYVLPDPSSMLVRPTGLKKRSKNHGGFLVRVEGRHFTKAFSQTFSQSHDELHTTKKYSLLVFWFVVRTCQLQEDFRPACHFECSNWFLARPFRAGWQQVRTVNSSICIGNTFATIWLTSLIAHAAVTIAIVGSKRKIFVPGGSIDSDSLSDVEVCGKKHKQCQLVVMCVGE